MDHNFAGIGCFKGYYSKYGVKQRRSEWTAFNKMYVLTIPSLGVFAALWSIFFVPRVQQYVWPAVNCMVIFLLPFFLK